jgi:hypothetical protein
MIMPLTRSHSPLRVAGYTGIVTWNQRISLLTVVVLAGLRLSGAICAMVCDSTLQAGSAHHGSENCAVPAEASTGAHIGGVSEHRCSDHDAVLRLVATAVTERFVLQADPTLSTAPASLTKSTSRSPSGRTFEYTSPSGTAPPTTTPLVLRV